MRVRQSDAHQASPPTGTLVTANALCATSTGAERYLWYFLRAALGFKFRRQHPTPLYVADFYCCELKSAIEFDGSQHDEENAATHSRTTTPRFFITRFWDNQLLRETVAMPEAILNVAPTVPSPSTKGKGL